MAGQNIDLNAALPLIEDLGLGLIAWFKRRSAEKGHPPGDAEVVAYVRGRVRGIITEADAFEAEGAKDPIPGSGEGIA